MEYLYIAQNSISISIGEFGGEDSGVDVDPRGAIELYAEEMSWWWTLLWKTFSTSSASWMYTYKEARK